MANLNNKMSLSKILTRAKVVDHVDFARKSDNIDDVEKFYRVNQSYNFTKDSIWEYTRTLPDGDWVIKERSLGEFIEIFGMSSRWYLI